MKYFYYAKKRGARILVVNPYREPALERYWVPSIAKSALFGTKMADEFFQVRVGGDIAFLNGVLKWLILKNWLDNNFIAAHTSGYQEMEAALEKQSWEELEESSGLVRDHMLRFAEIYASAKNAVFIWSMGLTQHRFGVEQRAALRAKGENPNLLVMTATPIPRSLALTVFGDLDLTVLDEMPPGRQPIETRILFPIERSRGYTFVEAQVEAGHQAYFIYPLVEESEKVAAKAAVEEQERLQREIFPHYRVGLLHGRMGADEKDEVMAAFRQGEYPILVSTSVVEVGVDVPNATVMFIEGANRFGLAQLHQFRGRVGRGQHQSYCLLLPDTDDAVENERLRAMEETSDGFRLAELDLEQRGPGDFLGTRQAGLADLRMARLTDVRLIERARREADLLVESDPELAQPEHQALRAQLQAGLGPGKGEIS